MQSLAWRWTFAILIGTAWNAIEPMIFGQLRRSTDRARAGFRAQCPRPAAH